MFVKKFVYKILLYGLRILVYVKRAGVWIFYLALRLGNAIGRRYRRTIGFHIYKLGFLIQKKVGDLTATRGQIFELATRRTILQVFLFSVGAFFMLPHSKLLAADSLKIPGRDTLIYKVVGPGDQGFDLEAVNAETPKNTKLAISPWREGAIGNETKTLGALEPISDIGAVGVSLGGRALNKPTIISSGGRTEALLPEAEAKPSEVIEYRVKSGDTISSIARRNQISVDSILAANHLTASSRIRPGDRLKILPVTGVMHLVRRGDTIGKIAKIYGVKEEEIVAFNKLARSGKNLIVGRELVIPHGRARIPTEASIIRTPKPLPQSPAIPRELVAASPEAPASSGYLWPAGVRRITQYFGLRHTGVDIAGPIGTPLYASQGGIVVRSQCGWNSGYGCHMIIDHGDGVETLYGHASALLVQVGETVAQGQTIAIMGSTGHATGPHIHFEIRVNGRRVNPLRYIR